MIPLHQPHVAFRTDHTTVAPSQKGASFTPVAHAYASGGVANSGGFVAGPKFGLMPINDFYVPKRFDLQMDGNRRLA